MGFHSQTFDQSIVTSSDPYWSMLAPFGIHHYLTFILNNQLEDIQRRALRIIYPKMSYKDSITQFNLPTLYDRRELLCESFYKNATRPDSKLFNLLPEPAPSHYNLRKPRRLPLFKCRTKRSKNSFIPISVAKWD